MSKQPTPKQRRSQRGSVEDRWRKRIKDADGNSVEVASAVSGQVTRWRARYVDNTGREHTRHFDRKVQARHWLDKQLAALLRGDHVTPKDAKLTVGEWCDKWIAGYGTRRKSTVRQAVAHIKIIKAHFESAPLSAVKPSDARAWTAVLKGEGRADSYVYALHSRLSQLFTDAVHDGLVARNPCSRRTSPGMGKQRPYVATTRQVWALYDSVPAGVRPAILLGAHAGLRLAEASALRVTDVDFAAGVVTPAVQWENEPLKSDTSRHSIPIPAEMSQLLAEAIPLGNGIQIVSDLWGNARRTLDDRTCRPRRTNPARPARGLPVPRPAALLRLSADRLWARCQSRAGPAPACLGEDDPRYLRPPVAGQGRHLKSCGRGRLQGKGRTMGFYETGVFVDSFDVDADGIIRAQREDVFIPVEIGQVVSVDGDETGGFARVVRFEGDSETGCVCLQELLGAEAEQAAKDLELAYDRWCNPVDD